MIHNTARFTVRPEHADDWPEIARAFTEATRAEPGCLWFHWSRDVDDPCQYLLLGAFREDAAADHVGSTHFQEAQRTLPAYLQQTPTILGVVVEDREWVELGEMRVPAEAT